MPIYSWRGFNIAGSICSGTMVAHSTSHLRQRLRQQSIELSTCKPYRQLSAILPITIADRIAFFQQLAILLKSGILLPQALSLIADQLHTAKLQNKVCDIAQQVEEGMSLSSALSSHANIFGLLEIQLVRAGEESGRLAEALTQIAIYLETTQKFHQKVRAALTLPLVTLGFFALVAGIILFVLIPQFSTIFASMNQELPTFTKRILAISTYLRHSYVQLLALITVAMLLIILASRSMRVRVLTNRILVHLPLIGPCIRMRFSASFFQAFALLNAGGVQPVPILGLLRKTVEHEDFAPVISDLYRDVSAGSSLSSALAAHSWLFEQDTIAMVHVGQESGTLATMCTHIAAKYHDQFIRSLKRLTLFIQPVLMMVLGGMVAMLIIAIYSPLCSMAHIA